MTVSVSNILIHIMHFYIYLIRDDQMLRWYGYLGFALIALAMINFFTVIQPFATWYIPIIWTGFILFVDSLVYEVSKKSLISTYPKEVLLMVVISIPFWTLFEVYNLFTMSWHYVHYIWYVHFIDFAIILPAFVETFSLFKALEFGKRFDFKKAKSLVKEKRAIKNSMYENVIKLLIVFGAICAVLPVLFPKAAYAFVWFGLLLFLDPLNYLTGRPSILHKISTGKKSLAAQIVFAGLITGFLRVLELFGVSEMVLQYTSILVRDKAI